MYEVNIIFFIGWKIHMDGLECRLYLSGVFDFGASFPMRNPDILYASFAAHILLHDARVLRSLIP